MKQLSDYPTPLTRANLVEIECADPGCEIYILHGDTHVEGDLVPASFAADLERKLQMCREAITDAINLVEEASTVEERDSLCERLQESLEATKPTP